MSNDLTGQLLADRYEIREQRAEEMLGRVYLAKDRSTGGLVNVKVLHPYLTQNVEKVRRFAREVTATSAIRHPNTVAVIDHGESGDLHWLVLEYNPARSLQEIVEQDGPLPVDKAIHVSAQIASALGAAHREGVVHRNLNPGTILLLENARRDVYVKVRDFGLSRLQGGDEDEDEEGHALTTAGARIGNTFYMAPEYIEEQLADPRGDVYALGCILYFMLTGHPPFTGRPAQVLDKHMNERPPLLSREVEQVPPWLDEFAYRLLTKNPNQRPTADTVRETLGRNTPKSLDPPPLLAIDSEGNAVPPSPVEQAMDNRVYIALAVGGAVVLMIVVVAAIASGIMLYAAM